MKAEEFKTRDLLVETGKSTHLTDREKHLIGMAVTATQGADLKKIDELCSDGICTTGVPE